MFPNNENPIFKKIFFFLCSVDDPLCPSAAINIHTRSLILCYSACAAGYNSLPVPVHVRHFLQFQGARPPPEPSPIRNDKLCRLAAMYSSLRLYFPLEILMFHLCPVLNALALTHGQHFSMLQHMNNTRKAAYIHSRHISSTRHLLTTQANQNFICSFSFKLL